jgi:hypothetical protein
MTTQPEALRLADEVETWDAPMVNSVAYELRRQHEVIAELLEALQLALSAHGRMLMSDPPQDAWKAQGVEEKARAAIRAAIDKATGEKKS